MEPSVDHLHILTVVDPTKPGSVDRTDIEIKLRQTPLRSHQFTFDSFELQEGWTIGGAIVYATNRLIHGSPVLVLGSYGQQVEVGGRTRPVSDPNFATRGSNTRLLSTCLPILQFTMCSRRLRSRAIHTLTRATRPMSRGRSPAWGRSRRSACSGASTRCCW